jgi:hypothetical protein
LTDVAAYAIGILSAGSATNNRGGVLYSTSNEFQGYRESSLGLEHNSKTNGIYRDSSHWYHLVYQSDRSNATSADRHIFSVNGVLVDDTTSIADQAYNLLVNNASIVSNLGRQEYRTGSYLEGYMAEVHFIDGQLLDHSYFGEWYSGVWVPKEYSGTYGLNGFYVDFSNASDLGEDQSGNNNDFTNSGAVQTLDTPTNNYPTFDVDNPTTGVTISQAGLRAAMGAAIDSAVGTSAFPTTGKWYFETARVSGSGWRGGIVSEAEAADGLDGVDPSTSSFCSVYEDSSTSVYVEGTTYAGYFSSAPGTNTVGVCVDMDNLKISWQTAADGRGTEYSISDVVYLPLGQSYSDSGDINFGAEGFDLTPPAGYNAINTENWPQSETPVLDGELGLWIVNYQGNLTARDITGCPFDPTAGDALLWQKNRDTAYSHRLYDTVRGADKRLLSNDTGAETTQTELVSFLTNGFSVSAEAGMNNSGDDFITWLFNMLPEYGMDIVTYTGDGVAGRTVAHNLGTAPEMIIIKSRDDAYNWVVWHKDLTDYDYSLRLNLTNAQSNSIDALNSTAPDASNVTLGSTVSVNDNGSEFIMYLFRSVTGFLKCGYYTGNGSADGPRIYTGFRTRYLLVKIASGGTGNWFIYDSVRNTYNAVGNYLIPNATSVEGGPGIIDIDFLSNGFKIRSSQAVVNGSGNSIIYLAIADNPYPYSNAF